MSRTIYCFLIGLALAILTADAEAASMGRWHVPGTPAQFFGYGFGPGHHAPIIRYPGHHTGRAPRVVVAGPHCRPVNHCASYGHQRPMMCDGFCQTPAFSPRAEKMNTAAAPQTQQPAQVYAR